MECQQGQKVFPTAVTWFDDTPYVQLTTQVYTGSQKLKQKNRSKEGPILCVLVAC